MSDEFVDDMRDVQKFLEEEVYARTSMCRADNGELMVKTPTSSQGSDLSAWYFSQRNPDLQPIENVMAFVYKNVHKDIVFEQAIGKALVESFMASGGEEKVKKEVQCELSQDPETLCKLVNLALEKYDKPLPEPSGFYSPVTDREKEWERLENELKVLQEENIILERKEPKPYLALYECVLKKAQVAKQMADLVCIFNANCMGASNFENDPENMEKFQDAIGVLTTGKNQLDVELETIRKDETGAIKDPRAAWECINFVVEYLVKDCFSYGAKNLSPQQPGQAVGEGGGGGGCGEKRKRVLPSWILESNKSVPEVQVHGVELYHRKNKRVASFSCCYCGENHSHLVDSGKLNLSTETDFGEQFALCAPKTGKKYKLSMSAWKRYSTYTTTDGSITYYRPIASEEVNFDDELTRGAFPEKRAAGAGARGAAEGTPPPPEPLAMSREKAAEQGPPRHPGRARMILVPGEDGAPPHVFEAPPLGETSEAPPPAP